MAPISKKLKSSLKLLVVVLINLPLSHTCFSLFILYRRILGATAHCQESQMGKRKPQMPPPPQGAHQQHCRVNITGKKKDLPIMIKVDIYLKVHNDNIHTYVIKQNYVIVHAYHNVIYNFFCRYSFYTDRAEFWTQSPSSYQVCHTLTTKNIFIEFAFLCISWLYISWFKSGITILIQLFFFFSYESVPAQRAASQHIYTEIDNIVEHLAGPTDDVTRVAPIGCSTFMTGYMPPDFSCQ